MSGRSFLHRMADASHARVRRAVALETESQLINRARATHPPQQLRLDKFDIIAELKLRSPAAGGLAEGDFDRARQLEAYAQGGAAAISVLTEPGEFKGELDHLSDAAAALGTQPCPLMRKDFLTEPYQVIEARAAGASGVLIIVTMLNDTEVAALVDCAREFGLFVLLEAFDETDLARISAFAVGQDNASLTLAGVNCRNLADLKVDFGRFSTLAPHLPRHLPSVAESGISSAADVTKVATFGYQLALVGSALMLAADPAQSLRELVSAGRAARSV